MTRTYGRDFNKKQYEILEMRARIAIMIISIQYIQILSK